MLSFVDLKEKYPNYSIINIISKRLGIHEKIDRKMGNKFAKIVFGTD